MLDPADVPYNPFYSQWQTKPSKIMYNYAEANPIYPFLHVRFSK